MLLFSLLLVASPLTLDDCIARALKNFPLVKQANAQVHVQEAQRSQAFWAWWTPIELTGSFGGPTPEAHGNAQFLRTEASLQGDTNLGQLGFYAGYQVQGAIPIYTFGKLTALREAAKAGVRIAEANTDRVKNETRANVASAFLGYSLAESFLQLAGDSEKTLNDSISSAQDLIKHKSDQVSDDDIFMLKTLSGQLTARRAEAEQGAQTAKEVVRFLINAPGDDNIELQIVDIGAIPEVSPKSGAAFEDYAKKYRPELRMAREAVNARDNGVTIRRGFLFPDLAIVGFLRQDYTSNQDYQRNPFTNSSDVDFTGGIGLGVKLTLDFPTKLAQLREAKAELEKSALDEEIAQSGILLQVRKAFVEAQGTWTQVHEYARSEKSGKSWLVSTFLNFQSGLSPARDIFQAVRTYSEVGALRRKAQFDFGMARVALAQAIGADLATVDDLWRTAAK